MSPASTRPIPEPSQWKSLEPACDEAILPPGIRLADETRTARHCFILLEGTATVEADGNRLPELHSGAYIGQLDESGRPLPPEGLTIQIATRSRVLVIDAGRLAELVDADPAAAAAWRRLSKLIRPPAPPGP